MPYDFVIQLVNSISFKILRLLFVQIYMFFRFTVNVLLTSSLTISESFPYISFAQRFSSVPDYFRMGCL
jgi:hypothetical protein